LDLAPDRGAGSVLASLPVRSGSPDYYGKNRDAFNDCFGDFVTDHSSELIAVVWDHVDVRACAAPATVVGAWALLECAVGSMPSLGEGVGWHIALDVFVVGDNEDFDRPGLGRSPSGRHR
jgi:hypothetical protein